MENKRFEYVVSVLFVVVNDSCQQIFFHVLSANPICLHVWLHKGKIRLLSNLVTDFTAGKIKLQNLRMEGVGGPKSSLLTLKHHFTILLTRVYLLFGTDPRGSPGPKAQLRLRTTPSEYTKVWWIRITFLWLTPSSSPYIQKQHSSSVSSLAWEQYNWEDSKKARLFLPPR